MLGDLNYLPVNWVDGMKISRLHFDQSGQYLHEQLRDVAARNLTPYNFGILPAEHAFEINVFCDFSQQINIELNTCKAITPNGCRIQLLPAEPVKLNTNFKEIAKKFNLQTSQSQSLLIIVTVNLFERVPVGEPLMNENPPRHPFTKADLKLDLIPAEQVNQSQLQASLVIGKIVYQNGELLHHKEYIPASCSIASLPALEEWHRLFRQQLESWEQYCTRIIQKINSKTQSQQQTTLSISILKLSENMLKQLASQKLYNQWIIGQAAPVNMFVFLLSNIQFINTLLVCYPEKEREEMLNYFAEWTDVQAGSIDLATAKSLQLQYNHFDIQQVFSEINQIHQLYIQIFQKLSMLDFIGKKKGQNIFVIEQEVKETKPQNPPQEKPNSRWSPLS
ncbi:MAG: hypothetical protein JST47_13410 [Bacteroidetes bacterium]|nr:hypothetical protein [Bacteroidota bacterium]